MGVAFIIKILGASCFDGAIDARNLNENASLKTSPGDSEGCSLQEPQRVDQMLKHMPNDHKIGFTFRHMHRGGE